MWKLSPVEEARLMKKQLRNDLLLTAGILLAAAVLWAAGRARTPGKWVVVSVGGVEAARYDLGQPLTVTIGETDYNVLDINGDGAAIIQANCGDHTCVRTGRIYRDGETIICLPHRLAVTVEGGGDSGFDAVVQ